MALSEALSEVRSHFRERFALRSASSLPRAVYISDWLYDQAHCAEEMRKNTTPPLHPVFTHTPDVSRYDHPSENFRILGTASAASHHPVIGLVIADLLADRSGRASP
eukprot:1076448-Prymnesium_polylepis.1